MTLTNIDHEKQIYCFKVFYAFLVVLLLRMNNPCIGCSEREMQALLAFKQGLVDDGNILLSWGREVQNKDCCQWDGVYCSNHTGHVVKLDLGDQSLQGLKHLDLSSTNLSDVVGWLEAVNMLPKLTDLIYGCNLPPPIISSVSVMNSSKSLVRVDLSYNNLNSSIFQLLSSTHTNLVELDLSWNNFTGVVGWLEAINMLPKLSNLILRVCNLPPPIILCFVMNSSKSLVHVDLSDKQS
ncbi:hypothetical protein Pyn_19085 [Prunus yedoensis var. nudiflora]|uniref:Leucine-rich repeat-containing N-terminal plant-type domain-containing protein n=1 Tax=Prunus yedoensis var. nudiflora TaxID=2094558 RepID=A0A314XWA1_PRUYE|nr:hypothetical protein Pyn_19085 [Prunus yedoensis var. nudiflora]